jgi:hypothetical protein
MKTAICTVYDGDYHYGVGVLTNSLYNHGFRGNVWVGYRGDLPFWAKSATKREACATKVVRYHELLIADGCTIKWVYLDTPIHLANYKPDFMWDVIEHYDPEIEALYYFDPDIVNKSQWDFYEYWVTCGVAICCDCWCIVPENQPRRIAWKQFAQNNGFTDIRELNHNYNAGFLGVHRDHKSILLTWKKIIEIASESGYLDLQKPYSHKHTNTYPYLPNDQCAMNLALMISSSPLSTIGPEGMDFIPGGTTMSHATVPTTKPWRKKLIINALKADPPTITDKVYWQHTQTPIQLYSQSTYKWNRFALLVGSAIGRFMRRPAI